MNRKYLCSLAVLIFLVLLQQPTESKKVVIHIPYRVKNVKHTHTVYKIIPHQKEKSEESEEDEKYEIYRKR